MGGKDNSLFVVILIIILIVGIGIGGHTIVRNRLENDKPVKKKDVVKEETILKRLGYELPFYVDLSIQLKLYGLIDNICYSSEELEDSLWN